MTSSHTDGASLQSGAHIFLDGDECMRVKEMLSRCGELWALRLLSHIVESQQERADAHIPDEPNITGDGT